ncbi:MAG TPA: trypsin-like peptidase domain-containing protein [Nitrososphaeraceae archaeon]|nr:trypsin-like peptidase domain-containing protein [Nitrososphaeraceae archaeon]
MLTTPTNTYIILILDFVTSNKMDTLANRKSRRVITCICVFTIAFILVSILIVNRLGVDAQQTETQNSTNNISSTNVTSPSLTPTEIFSKVQDSVVQVTTTNRDIAGPLNSGLGSGFVYDNDGHIITNYHVVALASLSGESSNNISSSNNNTEIIVTFNDGSVYNARVVGSDRFSDIAVLSVENISKSKLVPLTFGNSSQAEIGEQVVAIGNPFGLSGTLTVGVVSGLGRIIPSLPDDQQEQQQQQPPPPLLPENPFGDQFPDIPGLPFQQPPLIPDQQQQERSGAFSIPDIIQTDAAVNPGNSGGPLLNMEGQVIGMNTAIFSETGVYAGIGFAIPSNTITKIVPSLITAGSYQHPWLGLIGADITPDIAKALGLSLDEAKGFLVIGVNEGSPADKAGIRGGDRVTNVNGREIRLGGDIVLKIDNKDVRKIEDILTYLEGQKHVGDTVQLTIVRDGKTQTVNATLTPRQGNNQSQLLQPQSEQQQRPSLGILGTNLTPPIAKAMNITQPTGFLVVDIIAEGPADKAGIRGGYVISNINGSEMELGGDVILKIDNKTVNTIDDVLSYLDTKKVNDTVQLTILREGKVENLPVQLGPSSVTGGSIESPLEIQPSFPSQPPNNDSNRQQQSQSNSSNSLLYEFHNKCNETLGKSLCDRLFGQ